MNDLELYNFYKDFNSKGLYFSDLNQKNQWFYETDNMSVPIVRVLLDDFAKKINYHIEEAKAIVAKAKKIMRSENKCLK